MVSGGIFILLVKVTSIAYLRRTRISRLAASLAPLMLIADCGSSKSGHDKSIQDGRAEVLHEYACTCDDKTKTYQVPGKLLSIIVLPIVLPVVW